MTPHPYSIREAALLIGMSKFWLRQRIEDTEAVRRLAFKTRGDKGHWKLRAEFAKLAQRYRDGLGLGKMIAVHRPRPKKTPEPARGTSLMQIYREGLVCRRPI